MGQALEHLTSETVPSPYSIDNFGGRDCPNPLNNFELAFSQGLFVNHLDHLLGNITSVNDKGYLMSFQELAGHNIRRLR